MVFRHTLLSELLQLSVLVEKRSFSSQDVVTGRRLQCLSIHVRNGCKSSEYCCCEILTDRRLHIPICSGLNAVPHPHKEYAHVLTPRARWSLENFLHEFNKMRSSCTTWMGTKSKSSILRQKLRKREDGLVNMETEIGMMLLQAKECWSHQKLE